MDFSKIELGLTYDDIILTPQKSSILPSEVDVSTNLTKDIRLNIPIMSAAMDTVTNSRLAIVLARLGGIGIIHRAFSLEEQVSEVDKVKKSESGMIIDPIVVSPKATVSDVLALMTRFRISGVPVTDDNNKLIGIITNRDLRFETKNQQLVEEVMTSSNLITASKGIDFNKAKKLLHKHKIEKLPIVDDDFKLIGLITVKDITKKRIYPDACKDNYGRLRVGAAIGVGKDSVERAKMLSDVEVDVLVIDTAHGHSQKVIDTLKEIRKIVSVPIIVGNIATEEAAKELIEIGVDGLKVGVGPGSICTTRMIAGIGVPQLTAISKVYEVAKFHKIPVIADGGIKYSGDITKAIAFGAHVVMIGNLFAGTEESPGDTIYYQGRTYKSYRGMGSLEVMRKGRTKDRYMQQDVVEESKLVPEGIEGRVPDRGKLADVLYQLIGGLRSGMGYCGAETLDKLRSEAVPIQITGAGLRESHVHDLVITKEAPNYRVVD